MCKQEHPWFDDFVVLLVGLSPAIGKEDLIELMAQQPGWTRIPNVREDYTAFFWDDHLKKPVLVEVFIGKNIGSQKGIANNSQGRR